MARLELLGPPRWVDDRGVRPLPANRAACLVVRLASAGGWTSREALLPLLWPESDDSSARTSLRQLLRVLPTELAAVVDRAGDALRYTGPCDVADATLLELGGAWSDTLALHRGPFLDGFAPREAPAFDAWIESERARWANAVGTLARRAFDTAVAAGATEAAVDAGRKWVEHDPLEEEAATAVAVGLRHLGAHQEASRALGRHRTAAAALGVPVHTTVEAHAAVGGSMPSRAAGAVTAARGREAELAVLDAWWSGPGRWCTIVGPGGMGKTTLARAWIAANTASGFDVDVVDLNGVVAPAEATRRALAALARGTPSIGGVAGIAELVGGRTHALVLDGAEDLEAGGTTLATWLSEAPGLRLLVTSRRPLDSAGERVHRLGALSVARSASAGASVAAAVVWARALAAVGRAPSGEGVPEEVQHAVEQVGGWPLGLDLLAGWAARLGLERWRTALERDELVGVGGADTNDDGSRAIAASWRYLDGPRQEAVATLSGLPRPFELEDARGVGVPLALLGDLAATGWVTAADGAFTIHPLLVAHARDQLPARAATAAATHARVVLDRHVDAYTRTGRPPHGTWTRLHHLTAAWDHACSEGDVAALARALRPLLHILVDARRVDDLEWCVARARASLARWTSTDDEAGAADRATLGLELELSGLRTPNGEAPSAATTASLARIEAVARAQGDALAIARIEARRAIAAYAEDGDPEHAERVARRALEVLDAPVRPPSDRLALAVAAQLANLVGLAAGEQGRDEDLRTWIERAERYAHAAGGPSLAAGWGHNVAYLDIRHGRYHAALARNDAGLQAGLRDGAPIALAERWHQRALLLLLMGDATGAGLASERLLACSASMHATSRDRWQADAWRFLAEAALLDGDLGAAERSLARCPDGVQARRVHAELALACGDLARARRHAEAAIALLKQRGDDDRVLAARLYSLEATVLVAADDAAAPAAVANAIERALALRYVPEHARAARPASAWARAVGRSDLADELAEIIGRAPFVDAATRRTVAALDPARPRGASAEARAASREHDAAASLDAALHACLTDLRPSASAHDRDAPAMHRTVATN